jgi:alpha-tubulin suppressor-like RCC1 family protein
MYSLLSSLFFSTPFSRRNRISCGRYHSILLNDSGDVCSTGLGEDGQLGTGNTGNQSLPVNIDSLTNIRKISAGGFHSVFLDDEGEVYMCGRVGIELDHPRLSPFKIASSDEVGFIVDIKAGEQHSIFLTETGEVYSYGRGERGQLGTGEIGNADIPTKIDFFDNIGPIKKINAGSYHSFFQTEKGEVYACGRGDDGQLGVGDHDDRLFPTLVTFPPQTDPIKEISAGDYHTVVLTETGDVYACGNLELGNGDTPSILTPIRIEFPPGTAPVKQISAGNYHTIFLTQTGEVYACGKGGDGQLGTGDNRDHLAPVRVTFFDDVFPSIDLDEIAAGESHTIFLTKTGEVYACGTAREGQLGTGDNQTHPVPVKIALDLSS